MILGTRRLAGAKREKRGGSQHRRQHEYTSGRHDARCVEIRSPAPPLTHWVGTRTLKARARTWGFNSDVIPAAAQKLVSLRSPVSLRTSSLERRLGLAWAVTSTFHKSYKPRTHQTRSYCSFVSADSPISGQKWIRDESPCFLVSKGRSIMLRSLVRVYI